MRGERGHAIDHHPFNQLAGGGFSHIQGDGMCGRSISYRGGGGGGGGKGDPICSL